MAFDSTASGENANSYASVADGDTYFALRLDAADWTGATTATKESALVMATNRLEAEAYNGVATFLDQRLQWPRFGVVDRDDVLLDSDVVPRLVKEATFEMALAFIKEPTKLDDSGLEGFRSLALGSISVQPRGGHRADALPSNVKRLLVPVLLAGGSTRVERG